jgi:AraC-like DNA-binding protein
MYHNTIAIPAPPLPLYLEFGETVYQPGDQHPNRNNLGVFDLIIVKSGQLYMGEEETEWNVTSGQSLILLPDRYHYSVKSCTEETHFYWLHFHIPGIWELTEPDNYAPDSQASSYMIRLPKYWTLSDPKPIYHYFEELLEASLQPRSQAFWRKQQIFLELFKMLDEWQNINQPAPSKVLAEKTEVFIKQNYQRQITNSMLSDSLHYHYNYITKCLKEVLGVTPMEYVTQYRLEQAKLILLKTEWPIAQIAEQTGFNYPPYFSRCFTAKFGLPPLKFRKKYVKA